MDGLRLYYDDRVEALTVSIEGDTGILDERGVTWKDIEGNELPRTLFKQLDPEVISTIRHVKTQGKWLHFAKRHSYLNSALRAVAIAGLSILAGIRLIPSYVSYVFFHSQQDKEQLESLKKKLSDYVWSRFEPNALQKSVDEDIVKLRGSLGNILSLPAKTDRLGSMKKFLGFTKDESVLKYEEGMKLIEAEYKERLGPLAPGGAPRNLNTDEWQDLILYRADQINKLVSKIKEDEKK